MPLNYRKANHNNCLVVLVHTHNRQTLLKNVELVLTEYLTILEENRMVWNIPTNNKTYSKHIFSIYLHSQ